MNKIKFTKKLIAMMSVGLLTVTGVTTSIVATTSSLTAQASELTGSITIDTANYKMDKNNIYDIGITVKKGNEKLSGEQVKALVSKGIIKVEDSRTGSIVDLTQLNNGNFRVKAKNYGTCYITYRIMNGNQEVNHASVKIDVEKGVKQGGTSTRNTSVFDGDLIPELSTLKENLTSLKYEKKRYEFNSSNGKYGNTIEYPYFLGNSDLENMLNNKFSELYKTTKNSYENFDNSFWVDGYTIYTVEYNKNGVISIVYYDYGTTSYNGSSWGTGITESKGYIYDINTGEELTYKDILVGSESKVKSTLLKAMTSGNDESSYYVDHAVKYYGSTVDDYSFFLKENGLAFVFVGRGTRHYESDVIIPFTSKDTYKITL